MSPSLATVTPCCSSILLIIQMPSYMLMWSFPCLLSLTAPISKGEALCILFVSFFLSQSHSPRALVSYRCIRWIPSFFARASSRAAICLCAKRPGGFCLGVSAAATVSLNKSRKASWIKQRTCFKTLCNAASHRTRANQSRGSSRGDAAPGLLFVQAENFFGAGQLHSAKRLI